MKPSIGLCFLCSAAITVGPASAQRTQNPVPQYKKAIQRDSRSQAMSFHNPYTGGSVRAQLLLPSRIRPAAAIVLVYGANPREQSASGILAHYLVNQGYAVMGLPPVALSGATEEDNLNTIAALHYLETMQDLHGARVGLAGYGEGVRLAATAASQGSSAAFLMLLGGAVVPDRLNTLPDRLTPSALPKDEAVRSLGRVNCPVLVLIGEYDRQGTHRNAAANAQALRAALDAGKHKNYTIRVMTDSDDLLAETRPGGEGQSSTALPPNSVWKDAADWTSKQMRTLDTNPGSDEVEADTSKPIRIYPKSVYGPFNFRPDMIWAPAIGGQTRPYGFWYW